ncbi:MAG: hypothetical protein NVS3B6_13770 [Pseudarthrobacter sp.]
MKGKHEGHAAAVHRHQGPQRHAGGVDGQGAETEDALPLDESDPVQGDVIVDLPDDAVAEEQEPNEGCAVRAVSL